MDNSALFKSGYGVYIVAASDGSKINGQIANTVFQITSEPPTVAISINKNNLTHQYLEKSSKFAVSVLSEEAPMTFIGNFGFKSGREINKFETCKYKIGITGSPIVLDYSVAYLEFEVISKLDVGTHTVYIGKLIDADNLGAETPMTYAYYHLVRKGKSPKNAPTYVKEEKEEISKSNKEEAKMKKYKCDVCGYVYDPKTGDPDNGVAPGTSFEAVPEDWVCPICGAGKSEFTEESE